MRPAVPSGLFRSWGWATWLGWSVAFLYALFIALQYWKGYQAAAQGRMPVYTDFTPSYGASLLLQQAPPEALYHPPSMEAAGYSAGVAQYGALTDEQARGVVFSRWLYPPTFIPLMLPLAWFPYLGALLLWLLVTGLPYFYGMQSILGRARGWAAALAAPPTFYNAMFGQTGFLSGGLIGCGLALLTRRPVLAGVLFGLATVKPHLGALLPFALIAGGYWKTTAWAAATTGGLVLATIAAWGMEPWYAFIGTLMFTFEGFAIGAYRLDQMTTIFSLLASLGVPTATALGWQNVAGIILAGLTAALWWHGRRFAAGQPLRAALLCLSAPLAVPMLYVYDLVIVVPGAAWIYQDMRGRGASRAAFTLFWGALGALLITFPLAAATGVQTGPLWILLLLGLAGSRYRSLWRDADQPAALSSSALRFESKAYGRHLLWGALLVPAAFFAAELLGHVRSLFWDTHAYHCGLTALQVLGDPYRWQTLCPDNPFPYLYPPLVSRGLAWLGAHAQTALLAGMAGLYALALYGLFGRWRSLGATRPLLLCFGIGGAAVIGELASGNIGVIVAGALSLAVFQIERRPWFFALACLAGALFKPTYLLFLLVPALACGAYLSASAALAAAALLYALDLSLSRELFLQWLAQLPPALENDPGGGLWGLLAVMFPKAPLSLRLFLQLLLVAGLGWALLRQLRLTVPVLERALLTLLCVTLALPRLKGYDALVLFPALFWFAQRWPEDARQRVYHRLALAVVALPGIIWWARKIWLAGQGRLDTLQQWADIRWLVASQEFFLAAAVLTLLVTLRLESANQRAGESLQPA